MSKWHWIMAVAIAVALALGGSYLVRNRPISVRVVSLEYNVPVRVFGLGTIEARVLSRIGFEVGATLTELNADHGDAVKAGAVLSRLASATQVGRVEKARAGVLSAEVNLKKAESNVEKGRAVLAQRQEANKRKQALVGRSVVSEQSAEEAQRDEDVARAELAVAASEVEVARAGVADARASLAIEETALANHELRAPYDGIVIERHRELGSVVKAGDPIYTLVDPKSVWGLFYVDESRAGPITEGQRAEVRMRSRPRETFTGQVARIGLESDRVTEERRVYVKGDSPPPRVFLGEQVEAWITVATLDEALLVPESAAQAFDGRTARVWTVEGGRLAQRTVEIRHRTDDARLEIVGGLPKGAEVAAVTGAGFREGRRARIVREAGQ
ncbi:MAG: efflux RND transporter periplasmic adaptor subunit [Pseudomonadota bacterium]